MNDATRIELMKIVEGAVRPVRASFRRKRRMREDLLTHVSAIFEEEFEGTRDDARALRRTAKRFGDPKPLSKELQSSVPFWDGYPRLFDRFCQFQRGEPAGRRAFRMAGASLVFNVVFFAIASAAAWPIEFFLGRPHPFFTEPNLSTIGLFLTAESAVAFAFTLIVPVIRRSIRRPSGKNVLAAIGAAALSCCVIPAVGWSFYAAVSRETGIDIAFTLRTLPMGALTPLGLCVFAHWTEREIAHIEEWERLEVE